MRSVLATVMATLGVAGIFLTTPAVAQKPRLPFKSGHLVCNLDKTKCYVCPTRLVTPACRRYPGLPPREKFRNPNALPIGAELCELQTSNRIRNAAGRLIEVDPARYAAAPPVPSFRRVSLPRTDAQIDGSNGMLITGRDSRGPYSFGWVPGSVVQMVARAGPLLKRLPRTTKYEVCLYEEAKAAKCDQPGTIAIRVGDLRWEEGVMHREFPCGARGASSGFGLVSFRHLTQITRVFWKLRACNGTKCSGWTAQRPVAWVPPPEQLTPGDNASVRFPYGFTWTNIALAESYRLCIGQGAQDCHSSQSPGPGGDPWVVRVSQPTGANSGRPPGFSVGNTGNYQGLTRKWKAGTCVEITGQPNKIACVYNGTWRGVTFQ